MDDNEIIELYWNRSEQAIIETKQKYNPLCTKISLNILHSNEEAEECVSDAYLGVWNAIPTERPGYFSAFLCKIVRNLSLKRLSYNHAGKRNSNIQTTMEELENALATNINLSEKLEVEELVHILNEFLKGVPAYKRNVFIRRYFFFDTISDIANRYGYSKSKVKSILSRDGKTLCKFLLERGYGNEYK